MASKSLLENLSSSSSEIPTVNMHKNSAAASSPFISMLGKNHGSHQQVMNGYLSHWEKEDEEEDTDKGRKNREGQYSSLVNGYYDLVTDLFEFGWAQSFHFCRFFRGEPFLQALARHENYLALQLSLHPGMTVLDVGCGVGGPARQMAIFTGCKVTGLNNNAYQVERAHIHTQHMGLGDQVEVVKGDFMKMPFADNSFDAVYAIEATLHAPSLAAVYTEINRVLKPGGTFAVYEWVMTPRFQPNDPTHRALRHRIEHGDGIPHLATQAEAEAAMRTAGFTLTRCDDLADKGDAVPWWYPLSGEWRFVSTLSDALTMLRVARLGRMCTMGFLRGLELVGLCPGGTARAAECLEVAARSLVEAGQAGIFSPMFLMVGKKGGGLV
ncbi:sterol 24-c-methyltransferase-like protein [Tricladium varicosporioides]|nr:sterol 24-c-methyltransferase-like protein [Hymenoscyphus varicosporioides]